MLNDLKKVHLFKEADKLIKGASKLFGEIYCNCLKKISNKKKSA